MEGLLRNRRSFVLALCLPVQSLRFKQLVNLEPMDDTLPLDFELLEIE